MRQKVRVPPLNLAPEKSTVAPVNSAPEKYTSPPANSALRKLTVPPMILAPERSMVLPANLTSEKSTKPPVSSASEKSASPPPVNSAPEKLTVPPVSSAPRKVTVPPGRRRGRLPGRQRGQRGPGRVPDPQVAARVIRADPRDQPGEPGAVVPLRVAALRARPQRTEPRLRGTFRVPPPARSGPGGPCRLRKTGMRNVPHSDTQEQAPTPEPSLPERGFWRSSPGAGMWKRLRR